LLWPHALAKTWSRCHGTLTLFSRAGKVLANRNPIRNRHPNPNHNHIPNPNLLNPNAGKMVSKRMRCLALISHNNMKPAMQARLLVPLTPTHAIFALYLNTPAACVGSCPPSLNPTPSALCTRTRTPHARPSTLRSSNPHMHATCTPMQCLTTPRTRVPSHPP
jgi:hypothetical protein